MVYKFAILRNHLKQWLEKWAKQDLNIHKMHIKSILEYHNMFQLKTVIFMFCWICMIVWEQHLNCGNFQCLQVMFLRFDSNGWSHTSLAKSHAKRDLGPETLLTGQSTWFLIPLYKHPWVYICNYLWEEKTVFNFKSDSATK